MKKKHSPWRKYLVILVTLSSSCSNNNEPVLIEELLVNKTESEEKQFSDLDAVCVSAYDIEIADEVIHNLYNHEILDELSVEEWAGFFSGFSGTSNIPSLIITPNRDSILLSTAIEQKWFHANEFENCLVEFEKNLLELGFTENIENKTLIDQKEHHPLDYKQLFSSAEIKVLENVSPLHAYLYYSGFTNASNSCGILFASGFDEFRAFSLLHKEELNMNYSFDQKEIAFSKFRTLVHK